MKRVLLCSIDAPFIGGAGTNAYNLIKLLRNIFKHDVVGLFVYTDSKLDKDPHNIGRIARYNAKIESLDNVRKNLLKLLGADPEYMIAKNYISVHICKRLFPKSKIIFLPSGSSFYGHYCTKYGIKTVNQLIGDLKKDNVRLYDIVNGNGGWPCYPMSCPQGCDCEMRAIILSDKIIPNSEVTENLFRYLYKNLKTGGTKMTDKITKHIYTSGLYDYKYIYSNIEDIPFENRLYDIVFACYNWRRNLKNVDLINRIIKDSRFDEFKILVAGNGVNLVKKEEKFNVITLPCLDNRELLSYFNNTRCYVCPSYYDSFPNTITESQICGCNIVTSKNVGQYKLINPNLLVEKFYDDEEWITKIIKGTTKKMYSTRLDQGEILRELDDVL